jgi:hypothetical protein
MGTGKEFDTCSGRGAIFLRALAAISAPDFLSNWGAVPVINLTSIAKTADETAFVFILDDSGHG